MTSIRVLSDIKGHDSVLQQLIAISLCIMLNYTSYKNPGFWLVNSRCIFRVFSYLGLISFIFTTVGVFAWGFNIFFLCAVVFAIAYFTFLPSRASNRQIHSEYFLFTFIRMVTWLIKFETRKYSDVNVFPFFTLACFKPPNSSGIHNVVSNTPRLSGIRTHNVLMGTDCIGSNGNYKANYHTITVMTAPSIESGEIS